MTLDWFPVNSNKQRNLTYQDKEHIPYTQMTHSDWRRAKLGFTLIGENLLLHVSYWIASRLSSGDLIFFFFYFYRASQTSLEHLLMYCGETGESMTLCRLTLWTYKELDSLKTQFSHYLYFVLIKHATETFCHMSCF